MAILALRFGDLNERHLGNWAEILNAAVGNSWRTRPHDCSGIYRRIRAETPL